MTNAHWPGDILIPDFARLGLRIPCSVRTAKIASIETKTASRLGRLPDATWLEVKQRLQAILID